jgi:hypothetical protein
LILGRSARFDPLDCASAVLIAASWAAARVTAPAAEVLRNPRRVGEGDFADMVILLRRDRSFPPEDAGRGPVNQASMKLSGLNVRMVRTQVLAREEISRT